MTAGIRELASHLDELLRPAEFSDYCPNGLQIDSDRPVRRVAAGVSANQAFIDRALAWGADACVVHHGFFWKGEPPSLTGYRGRRVRDLCRADVGLIAYHLPLDAHRTLGNNAGVLDVLGLTPETAFGGSPGIGWTGSFDGSRDRGEVVAKLGTGVGPAVASFLHGPTRIKTVAVVTGGGAGFFEEALDLGADLYITGEPSEQSQGIARETQGNFLALGHHATERFGPRALLEHIAATYGAETLFIDIDNPV